MVQKWPEINGRQFTRTDGRTDSALGLGEEKEEEDFRKYEKEDGGKGEGIINHESRCDFDSMCTIRRHLTPIRSDRVTTSKTSVGQMMRRRPRPSEGGSRLPLPRREGGRQQNPSISFVGFECRCWRPKRATWQCSERGTIFWRFL